MRGRGEGRDGEGNKEDRVTNTRKKAGEEKK